MGEIDLLSEFYGSLNMGNFNMLWGLDKPSKIPNKKAKRERQKAKKRRKIAKNSRKQNRR